MSHIKMSDTNSYFTIDNGEDLEIIATVDKKFINCTDKEIESFLYNFLFLLEKKTGKEVSIVDMTKSKVDVVKALESKLSSFDSDTLLFTIYEEELDKQEELVKKAEEYAFEYVFTSSNMGSYIMIFKKKLQ